MIITDKNGNSVSGNYFTIVTENSDVDIFHTKKIELDHSISSTIISIAISEYIDREFNDDYIVYKKDK